MIKNVNDIEGWGDLPRKVRESFEKCFNENPEVRKLKDTILMYNNTGNYVLGMVTAKKLNEIRQQAQKNLMNDTEECCESIALAEMGLPEKSLEEINVLTIAMYVACDLIDAFAMEINSRLKLKDSTARFEMFNSVIEISKEIRERFRYLNAHTRMFDDDVFNNTADDMRDMLLNKSRKIYKNYSKIAKAAKESDKKKDSV